MEPDQLINWFFWAEDTGPTANRALTAICSLPRSDPSSKSFVKVIQPATKQQQQQQQSPINRLGTDQAAETNHQRHLETPPPTRHFGQDAVLVEGQTEALTKACLLDAGSDEKATEHAKAVVARWNAPSTNSPRHAEAAALMPALAAEQVAYQSLLRLQAHEFQVSQQQQQQSSQQQQQQSNQRAQSQLDQLNLRKQEDRYETERQARKLEEPKQREQLQVLSRLRDLAQRQQDLNEKLKELESALRAPRPPSQREIERRSNGSARAAPNPGRSR